VELINATRMVAGYTVATDVDGREHLVIVVKGTFHIPSVAGSGVRLGDVQEPLLTSDVFFGEPGLSAPRWEAEYVLRKPRCDVLLNGTAHAPRGRPAERVLVGMRVGSLSKSFAVVGDRHWIGGPSPRASKAVPFVTMPLEYGRAFGGVALNRDDPAEHFAYLPNPVGRGYHKQLAGRFFEGEPLPNLEEKSVPVTDPGGDYRPMSFGPVGRSWMPRVQFGGTYDQKWQEEVFPFLPADFDDQYFQCAPADQQIPKPAEDLRCTLINLTAEGRREFLLPRFEAPIHVFPRSGGREDLLGLLDTVCIDPDIDRATLVWRVARPLRRNIFEIEQVLVGRKGPDWWQEFERPGFPVPVVVEFTD
jgi:hypothetical protein